MIIFVNGPPGSGKTTAVNYLYTTVSNSAVYKMSWPLMHALPALLQIEPDAWHKIYQHYKNTAIFKDKSPRQLLIMLSDFLNVHFGEDTLGHIACLGLKGLIFKHAIIDIGFTAEALPITEQYQCVCLQLERPGCSFENDSREYLDCDKLGIPVKKISNRHDLDIFHEQLAAYVKELGI